MNPRIEPLTVAIQRRVTFSEVDAVGYVHHANAAIWFEQAREAYFRKFDVPFVDFARRGIYLAMRDLHVRYEEFVAYDDWRHFVVKVRQMLFASAGAVALISVVGRDAPGELAFARSTKRRMASFSISTSTATSPPVAGVGRGRTS